MGGVGGGVGREVAAAIVHLRSPGSRYTSLITSGKNMVH